jgi:hypothetical protein
VDEGALALTLPVYWLHESFLAVVCLFVCLFVCYNLYKMTQLRRVDGWMDGWMDGWVGGCITPYACHTAPTRLQESRVDSQLNKVLLPEQAEVQAEGAATRLAAAR